MSRGLRIRVHAATDVGRVRQANEDAYFSGNQTFAVADGMGGHAAGEVASAAALEPIAELDGQHFRTAEDAAEAIADAIRLANRSVVGQASGDPSLAGMGTTLTAAIVRDGRLHIGHVGDSRAYLVRPGQGISQLTTDHTLVEELVREGRITRDEISTHPQRSVVTRAIGVEPTVEVDSLPPIELVPGDQVLLCSDGLSGQVEDNRIAALLQDHTDGDAACAALIDAANAAGGPDNITVVLLRVEGKAAQGGAAVDTDAQTQDLAHAVPADTARAEEHTGLDESVDDDLGEPRRRGRTVAIVLVSIVLVLGLAAGLATYLLSQSYFVGDDNGTVAIFTGVPYQVAGVPLNRVIERTDLDMDDLPERRQRVIRQGLTAGSVSEARDIVEREEAAVTPSRGTADDDDETGADAETDA